MDADLTPLMLLDLRRVVGDVIDLMQEIEEGFDHGRGRAALLVVGLAEIGTQQRVVGMERVEAIGLDIQDAQDAALKLERDHQLGARLRQGWQVAVTNVLAHVGSEDSLSGGRSFADQTLSQRHIEGQRHLLAALARGARTGPEAQMCRARFQREYGDVVVVKCLLNELCYTPCQFIRLKHGRYLCADLAHQVELSKPEAFHLDTMRGIQADGHDTRYACSSTADGCRAAPANSDAPRR